MNWLPDSAEGNNVPEGQASNPVGEQKLQLHLKARTRWVEGPAGDPLRRKDTMQADLPKGQCSGWGGSGLPEELAGQSLM